MTKQRTTKFEREAELDYWNRDRKWWRKEAIKTRTDWSSLLRQRLRVLAWVRAGRPPWAEWQRKAK